MISQIFNTQFQTMFLIKTSGIRLATVGLIKGVQRKESE